MYRFLIAIIVLIITISCNNKNEVAEKAKKEILQAESEFAAFCSKEGISKSFPAFAARNAVVLSGEKIVMGQKEIKKLYADPKYSKAKLDWKPDFVDASESGDMGYTFGHYIFTLKDSSGNAKEYKGIFHTVWKKENGEWKFVWDS